jgi:hypothetical protein
MYLWSDYKSIFNTRDNGCGTRYFTAAGFSCVTRFNGGHIQFIVYVPLNKKELYGDSARIAFYPPLPLLRDLFAFKITLEELILQSDRVVVYFHLGELVCPHSLKDINLAIKIIRGEDIGDPRELLKEGAEK